MIGTAWAIGAGEMKQHRCYGTFLEDMPDPKFRFNILFVKHNGAFKMHAHEYCELVIVLGGCGVHLTDYENYPLEEGDAFVITGHTRHGFKDACALELCNIQYDPHQFLFGQRSLDKMMGYHALFDLEPRCNRPGHFNERLHLATEDLVYVRTMLASLKNEFENRSEGSDLVIKITFLLLVTYLARLYGNQKRNQATALVRMANVMSHIQNHYRETLRIEDLARLAYLSTSQFQRIFKRTYHISPKKFINQIRLREAREMLKNPNHDVTGVAYACGFSSSSFFATQFKQHFGECPSYYRRQKLVELAYELNAGSL